MIIISGVQQPTRGSQCVIVPKSIFGVGAWNVNCTSSIVHVCFVPQCQISVPLIKVIPRFNLCVILRRNNDTRTHNQNQFRNRRVLINSIFRTVPLTFIHRNNSQRYLIDWGRASSATKIRTLWNCRAPPRNESYYSQNEELCIIDIWPGL